MTRAPLQISLLDMCSNKVYIQINYMQKLLREKDKQRFRGTHQMCPVSALNLNGSQISSSLCGTLAGVRSAGEPDNLGCSMGGSHCNLGCSCCCNGNSQSVLSLLFRCLAQCFLWCYECRVLITFELFKRPSQLLPFLKI